LHAGGAVGGSKQSAPVLKQTVISGSSSSTSLLSSAAVGPQRKLIMFPSTLRVDVCPVLLDEEGLKKTKRLTDKAKDIMPLDIAALCSILNQRLGASSAQPILHYSLTFTRFAGILVVKSGHSCFVVDVGTGVGDHSHKANIDEFCKLHSIPERGVLFKKAPLAQNLTSSVLLSLLNCYMFCSNPRQQQLVEFDDLSIRLWAHELLTTATWTEPPIAGAGTLHAAC
jgi:hypothetical protein